MLRSATSFIRTWARSFSARASFTPKATTVLHRHESWVLRLGAPVIFLQGMGLTYACATIPLGRTGENTSVGKRTFYTASALSLTTAALLVCRSLSRRRLIALRIDNARRTAQLLSRQWYDPTGTLFIAATPTIAPRSRSRVRLSFSQLERAAETHVTAKGGQKSRGRKEAGFLAIRVYENVTGRGERIETFSVDTRECDVFDVAALRKIALNDDLDERGQPIDAALR